MTDRPKQRNLKLELTWVGKDHRPRLEPRILLPDEERSYTADARVDDNDQFDNMLIFGDNLLALKALATDNKVKGQVKCIFIDPPYNTGSAFEHYDDGMEHSLWLGMMRERLELLRDLLTEDGSIWISIDDNEAHYLKVLCDEIFGRQNFVADVIWEKSDSPRMDARTFSVRHDHVLVFSRNIESLYLGRIQTEIQDHYNKVDEQGRRYYTKPLRAMGGQGDTRLARPTLYFGITAPDGEIVYPKKQDGVDGAWRWKREKIEAEIDRIEWVQGRTGWVPYYRIYAEDDSSRPPETIWAHEDTGSNRTSKAEVKVFNPKDPFSTPKPERLLQRVIQLATQPGDLVLDSFAGSGTTGAVAHKMGRRWIMVELGEHAHTHIIPRMQKVIDGTDRGGISDAVGWKGGGGFRYYRLAPSLIKYDSRQHPIINPEYNAEMLAEACCKLEGFTYDPSQAVWWQHGRSSERDFLFVTTRYMSHSDLLDLSEEVGPERSLLVLAKAYDRNGDVFDNLTVKKIPDAVLGLCEWDHDDYSLKVANLPKAKPEPEPVSTATGARTPRKGKVAAVPGLFDMGGEA
ncbi:adenine-specific DNA-methyltransferase [Deinococcus sp. HSC-46F16]|uniref:site-specific DNA-methyltransferase n=1 Tax=Deinococcus sp. HSC-46F16 TaxID=2910968 RepID=UPI0020A1009F|nr:site-specific DNA-methyltransferase [Deinococcus sp. HSC-46F16]MCP2014791.1 adenine-specific DNA-methyltransferase [Deinococcus sp. HSC-46F16]